jgi:hypothetical protein
MSYAIFAELKHGSPSCRPAGSREAFPGFSEDFLTKPVRRRTARHGNPFAK